MATREELITLFGDDFGEVLVGLDQLPREVLELLDTTMEKMLFDADVFTSRIAKTVGTQTSAGVATSSIEDILANDMGEEGRIFGELRNTVKESLVEGINQTSRAGAFQAYDPDEDTLFTWVTVAGHRICKDCLPRGGERKTLRDWEAVGVPASGWSICGGYCYCILDPSGKISPRVQLEEREGGLRIQEKGATARPKTPTASKWKATMTQEEAREWAKNSTIQGELYHGSSNEAIDNIAKTGFSFDKRTTGKIYGNGAYTTRVSNIAAGFAPQEGLGKIGVFIANTKKTLDIKRGHFFSMQNGFVDSMEYVTRGHVFMEKAKLGLHDLKMLKKQFNKEMKGKINPKTGKPWTYERYVEIRTNFLDESVKKAYVPNQGGGFLNKSDTRYTNIVQGTPDTYNKLAGEWFNYIEDQYNAGNTDAISAVQDIFNGTSIDDMPFSSDGWANLMNSFMQHKQYDSMIIRGSAVGNVRLASGAILTDDFFLVLKKELLTLIGTRQQEFIQPT